MAGTRADAPPVAYIRGADPLSAGRRAVSRWRAARCVGPGWSHTGIPHMCVDKILRVSAVNGK